MRYSILSIAILSLLVTMGCQKSTVIDELNASAEGQKNEVIEQEQKSTEACYGDLEINTDEINSDVLVKAYYHPSCANKIVFHSKSEKTYPTGGYQIASTVCYEGKTIEVSYKKIIEPTGPVTMALSPAYSQVKMPELEKGTYRITFSIDRSSTSGQLMVTDEGLQLGLREDQVKLWKE